MAASVLENIRTAHEEIEVLEKAVATCLDNKPKAHYGGLLTEAKASAYLCRIQHLSNRLLHLYEDADATKRVEAAALAGADHMALFYERLADVRGTGSSSRAGDAAMVHGAAAAGPSADPAAVVGPLDARVESEVASWFSAAEMYGRYVDMEAGVFDSWSALPGVKEARSAAAAAAAAASSGGSAAGVAAAADVTTPFAGLLNSSDSQRNGGAGGVAASSLPAGAAAVDYSAFLSRFVELHVALPPRVKASRQYRRHVTAAAQYLLDFFCRSRPLVDVTEDLLAPLADEFAATWGPALRSTGPLPPGWGLAANAGEEAASGGVAGQAVASADSGSAFASASLIDLGAFASASQLAAQLSPEQLRQQLVARGLKGGGTPQERAQRLWQVRGLTPQQYPRKLLLAAPAGAGAPSAPVGGESVQSRGMEVESEAGYHPSAAAAPGAAAAGKSSNGGSSVSSRDEGSTAVPALSATSFFSNRVLPAFTASTGGSSGSSAEAAAAPVPALPIASHTVQQVLQPAWCEAVLARFAGAYLADTLTASRKRADRRATRTAEEWAAEVEAEEAEVLQGSGRATAAAAAAGAPAYEAPLTAGGVVLDAADDDEDEEGATQYAANVVLGEDGKPIPYWLYKLHGLNIEYTCEICGGAGYRGRRAFDRHFQEWRHAYGMRCLGIPNTKHFHDITRIADALGLWEKLRGEGGREAFRPEAEAEFEDSAGNVLDRRTYEDLARQGLL
jgi:splicing factor 3A subunit 3